MKILGLVLALLVVGSGMAVATSVTIDLYSGNGPWNYISCPLVPFDPSPYSVFAGVTPDYSLFRYDAPSQSTIYFEDGGGFGNILLGEGYFFANQEAATSISYSGVPDGVPDSSDPPVMTDMWISLPGNQLDAGSDGGWHLIGQPFNHDTASNGPLGTGENVSFTDGTSLKTWDEAVTAGWVEAQMLYFDNANQNQLTMTYQGWGEDDTLRAKSAYWLYTHKDNLAMIIPAVAL